MENHNTHSEILYDKTYTCPVCDLTFTSKAIRSGKNKIVSTDTDLYSKYSLINPLLYDVIVCDCGYAAISNTFSKLRQSQIKLIKSNITSKYLHTKYPDYLSTEDAINRYKLALLNSITKKSKIGEQAYICLKIGWLYRDLQDVENEKIFLEHARKQFITAFSTESFPVFELDEDTTMYIIAELSRKAGKLDEAKKWISDLILKPGVSSRLKERALDLKNSLK